MINPPKYYKNVTFLIFKSWGGGYKINNNVCISPGLGEVNVSVYLQELPLTLNQSVAYCRFS